MTSAWPTARSRSPTCPDLPLTTLKLNITGPNGKKAFKTDCTPASIGGTFTAQSGVAKTVDGDDQVLNCASNPTVTGSNGGLASGHPKLKFKVTHGKGAAQRRHGGARLPSGLKFSRSAIVKHKTCTTRGQEEVHDDDADQGPRHLGGKAKTVAIKGGKLVITLKKAAGKVTITLSGPLVAESKALQTKVKKHKAGT